MAKGPRTSGIYRLLFGSIVFAAAGSPLAAQQPSVQQQFETATSQLAARQWSDAVATFDGLEARLNSSKNERSIAIVRVRKAEALLALDRVDEAETALKLGLAALPANDPSLREDRYLALMASGDLAMRRLDFGEGLKQYRAAVPIAIDWIGQVRALAGTIKANLFFDPDAALKDADATLALVPQNAPHAKELRGQIRTLRGRVLLNLKRFEEARRELDLATRELGGLTLRVDVADISTRSDSAIASLLAGNAEQARKYMAYTGAGRLAGGLQTAAAMTPPPCEGEDGLQPSDVAVVEFSIRDDGSVAGATPIYSNRRGESAIAFARAVANWSWTPDAAKTIPPFFRQLTRIELRCSTVSKRPSIIEMLHPEFEQWLAHKGVPAVPDGEAAHARRVKNLTDELVRRESVEKDGLPVVPALVALSGNVVISEADRIEYLTRASVIARRETAPAIVQAYLRLRLAKVLATSPRSSRRKAEASQTDLRSLLMDSTIQSDTRALAAVRLFDADRRYDESGDTKEGRYELAQVRDAPGLGRNDPLRTGALIRLASMELAAGRATEAQAAFSDSGLQAEQCALLDRPPRLRQLNASSANFPNAALEWGFEGWVRTEYDILADGTPTNVRAIAAYPPFVFNDAATKVMARSRYEASFRPNGGIGCGGMNQNIKFQL